MFCPDPLMVPLADPMTVDRQKAHHDCQRPEISPSCSANRSIRRVFEGTNKCRSKAESSTRSLERSLQYVASSEVAIDFGRHLRSEEHTSELQSLMRTPYDVFSLKKKQYTHHNHVLR